MSVPPPSLLIQGAVAMVISSLTMSASWGIVATFIPFAVWTMIYFLSYPAFFTLFAMGIDFICLIPFAWAGEIHAHYWESHPFLNGKIMYMTAHRLGIEVQDEIGDKELQKDKKGFVQNFLGMMFWRCLLFIGALVAVFIPGELNWTATHIFLAYGLVAGGVILLFVLFYFLFTRIGTDRDLLVFKTLYNNDKELVPFTFFLGLGILLYVIAYGVGRHVIASVDWFDLWWWLLPLLSGGGLLLYAFFVGRLVPIRNEIQRNRKLRRKKTPV